MTLSLKIRKIIENYGFKLTKPDLYFNTFIINKAKLEVWIDFRSGELPSVYGYHRTRHVKADTFEYLPVMQKIKPLIRSMKQRKLNLFF